MTKVSNTILEKIEHGQIEPVAVWRFTAKNWLFWSLWALCVLIGAIAVSAMLFVFTNAPWALKEVTHENTTGFVLDLLPFFWIIALGLMLALGLYNVRHTKTGYKYSLILIILLNILASIIFGFILFVIGMGEIAENASSRFPLHESIFEMQMSHWSNPGGGLLAGEVTATSQIDSQTYITLTSFDQIEWTINISDLSEQEKDEVEIGEVIAIIGMQSEDENEELSMYACALVDWGSCCSMPPFFMSERFEDDVRSTNCEGVRPFEALRRLRAN